MSVNLKNYFLARFSSRKALISILLIFIATGLIIANKLPPDHYVSLIEFIIGSYLAAQGAVDLSDRLKKGQPNAAQDQAKT
jgi:hypothetical protein